MRVGAVKNRFFLAEVKSSNLSGKGIYVLFNFCKEIVYIGKSYGNIENDLLCHLSEEEGTDAKYFSAIMVNNPDILYNNLIEAYKTAYFGKLPDDKPGQLTLN